VVRANHLHYLYDTDLDSANFNELDQFGVEQVMSSVLNVLMFRVLTPTCE
jgi:hypothetical protein